MTVVLSHVTVDKYSSSISEMLFCWMFVGTVLCIPVCVSLKNVTVRKKSLKDSEHIN